MIKGFTVLAGAVVVGGLALGAGLAMWQSGTAASANQQPRASQATAPRSQTPGTAASSQETGTSGRGMAGVTGVVENASGDTLTVRTPNGAEARVALTTNTAVRKTVTVTASQVGAGETVLVMGTRGADGVVAARTVQVGATDAAEQAGQATGGPLRQGGWAPGGQTPSGQATGGMGNIAQVAGTVESAGEDKLVVKTTAGNVTVTVSEQTSIRKTVDGARSDLAQGVTVLVAGQQGTDGSVVATSVQIMPEGAEGALRRPNQITPGGADGAQRRTN